METLVFETSEAENLFETVMQLPEKYRIVIHLYYYEDYAVSEIANILKLTESNVKNQTIARTWDAQRNLKGGVER